MPMPISRQRAHLIGIFIVAFAVLAYQVLLTRLFSVMLYYHFAFAGVSLVMLGLTIGAERVYLNAQKYSADRLEAEWSKAACRFAVSGVAVVLWFIYAPLLVPARLAFPVLIASLILFAVPLVFSGICVTLILTRSGFPIGRLYAADLIGAAAGCIGIVALLFLLDPISIFLALAALIAVSAWIMAPPRTRPSRQAGWLTAAFCVVCAGQSALYLTGQEHVRVVWAKGHPQAHILFERWNALSRIRVIPYQDGMQGGSMGPFGWGFGHAQTQKIDQLYLDIDADASTVITRFDGTNLKPFAFLGNDVINAGYHVRPVKTAAVVGVGGGRDVMSALYFGVAHVTGIEINPAIFEALTKRFADFTGHFYRRPDVTLVNAEARSWINQNHNRFDLIQISLIDTWAATAAGGADGAADAGWHAAGLALVRCAKPPVGILPAVVAGRGNAAGAGRARRPDPVPYPGVPGEPHRYRGDQRIALYAGRTGQGAPGGGCGRADGHRRPRHVPGPDRSDDRLRPGECRLL
jgi:hypothetical protein